MITGDDSLSADYTVSRLHRQHSSEPAVFTVQQCSPFSSELIGVEVAVVNRKFKFYGATSQRLQRRGVLPSHLLCNLVSPARFTISE